MGDFTIKQSSFSGGVVSPQLLSRADTGKFASGLRYGNNVAIRRFGSMENRPGTEYLDAVGVYAVSTPWSNSNAYLLNNTVLYNGVPYLSLQDANTGNQPDISPLFWQTLDPQGQARIVRFVFNYAHSYELIFSRNQIAIYKGGVRIAVPSATAATWNGALSYVIGNVVFRSGALYIAREPVPPAVDPVGGVNYWMPMVSLDGGVTYLLTIPVDSLTQVGTVIPEESLFALQAVNDNDVMTVVSQSFHPFQITRFSDTAWTVTPFTPTISIGAPTGVAAANGTAGTVLFTYGVTAISGSDGAESVASSPANCTGGTPTPAAPNVITWTPVAGAVSYRVYRLLNGVAGLVGITTLATLSDQNVQPDYSQQPPVKLTNADGSALFSTLGNWPAAISCYQQRQIFANTVNQPTTFWASRVGSLNNFTVSTPIADADAMEVVIASEQSQPIIAMLDLQKLIIHTGSAEYACNGNVSGALTPQSVNLSLQGTAGCALPRPVVIGTTDIFIQARGTRVRNLEFSIQTYGYKGKDLTLYAPSLFSGLTITGMAWQQIGDSILWLTMSNGTVVACTYVEEQDIWAWTSDSFTNGSAEDVCVVPDATTDTVYFIMRRVINGVTVRYLESYADRDYLDTVFYSDYFGVDCGLAYDGTYQSGSLTTTTSGGWTQSDLITLDLYIFEPNTFAASDVTNGNQVVATLYDAVTGLPVDRVTFSIVTFVNAQQAQGYAQRAVPTWAQGNIASAGKAVTHFTGFSHLKGQQISALGDGEVLACPLESTLPKLIPTPLAVVTVANDGSFVLPKPALHVSAGLPIQWDAQTLPLENESGTTIMDKQITVKEATPIVYNARPAFMGQDNNHLLAMRFPVGLNPPPFQNGWPPAPFTGPHRQTIQGTPSRTGQVWMRGIYPLPFGCSGVIITGTAGT